MFKMQTYSSRSKASDCVWSSLLQAVHRTNDKWKVQSPFSTKNVHARHMLYGVQVGTTTAEWDVCVVYNSVLMYV